MSVAPNNASLYLNSTDLRQFANSSECVNAAAPFPSCRRRAAAAGTAAACAMLPRTWEALCGVRPPHRPHPPADEVQGGYWSVQLPWVHLVALSNYVRRRRRGGGGVHGLPGAAGHAAAQASYQHPSLPSCPSPAHARSCPTTHLRPSTSLRPPSWRASTVPPCPSCWSSRTAPPAPPTAPNSGCSRCV